MYRIFIFLIFSVLSIQHAAAQYDILFLEFSPYTEYYVNIDGVPYYASSSAALIPDMKLGSHTLTLTIKGETNEKHVFDLEIEKLPIHLIVNRTSSGISLDLDTKKPEEPIKKQYIEDITISADSISYSALDEDLGCPSYTVIEMEFLTNQYYKVKEKENFIKRSFRNHCLTGQQLKKLMDASLTTKERFFLLEELHGKVTGQFSIRDVESYFLGTEYYADVVKIRKRYE